MPEHEARPSLWRMALTFARIGTIGFGGGAGMLALIRQELVKKKRWLDDSQLGVAVAMAQMLPGPFVSNYAEYIGHELHGTRGMVVAVVALLLPSFVLMCVLSVLYSRYGSLPVVERVFMGVQPVVAGILGWATWNIGRAHVSGWRPALVAALAFAALLLRVDVVLVILGCGVLGILLSGAWRGLVPSRTPAFLIPLLMPLGAEASRSDPPSFLARLAGLGWVFLKIGTVIFGGGFAAIPFLQHEVVDVRHWLTAKEFIDGVALGQVTPGPVAIMATYVGFRVLGLPGAVVSTVAVFLPSFFLLLGLVHVYRRVKGNLLVQGFLLGVMPAVTGMLLSATVFIARNAVTGPATAIMAALTLVILLRFRADPVWLVLGGAAIGLVLPTS